MSNDRIRNIGELESGAKNIARPLQILRDRCRGKAMRLPHAEANARADVVERTCGMPLRGRHSRQCISREWSDHPRGLLCSNPVRQVVSSHPTGLIAGKLPGKCSGNQRIPQEWFDQCRKPACGSRNRILNEQDRTFTPSLFEPVIACLTMVEGIRSDAQHSRAVLLESFDGTV